MSIEKAALMKRASVAVAGPLAVGLCLALRVPEHTSRGLSLPVVFIGVTVLMLPALYIGAALSGLAPSAPAVARAAGTALERAGLAFLGLAPALAFLSGTSTWDGTASVLTGAVLLLGAAVGLTQLFREAFAGGAKAVALFVVWAVVTLGIGGHLIGG